MALPPLSLSSQSAANSAAQGGVIGASSSTRSIGGVTLNRGLPTWAIVGLVAAAALALWWTHKKG